MSSKDQSPIPDYASFMRLDGRNFIVSGAGRGMGRHSSHALSQSGAKVMTVDIEPDLAKEVAEEVGGIAHVGDMTKEQDVEAMVAHASEEFGGQIHGLVDIIGIAEWFDVVDTDESVWDHQFDMCIRHTFLLSKHVGKAISATGAGGTMVFIASVHGLSASVRHAAYGAAKAGVISMVKTVAHELGSTGVRVNAIAPGSILTPRMEIALDDERRANAAKLAVLGRIGRTSDIASAVLFLSSDQSSYVTGQTLVVDGGVTTADPFTPL
jgi:NAD(P)-dependent dehydrogenase (short-subunit alcohol dehydrogenase family)